MERCLYARESEVLSGESCDTLFLEDFVTMIPKLSQNLPDEKSLPLRGCRDFSLLD